MTLTLNKINGWIKKLKKGKNMEIERRHLVCLNFLFDEV
jgi:hypothetical protein